MKPIDALFNLCLSALLRWLEAHECQELTAPRD